MALPRLLIASLLMWLVACTTPSWNAARPWAYGDVRLLDPSDAPTASVDILAVYLRRQALDFQIRVDLLDLSMDEHYLWQIFLHDGRQYARSPLVINIPSQGGVTTIDARNPKIRPRVVRDPWLDTLVISLNSSWISEPVRVDVVTFRPGDSRPSDLALDVRSDATPPQRAPLLLTFWETFPAMTPSQALRRWDGAHVGPTGERHGLRHILDNAQAYSLPVALLDFKTPQSLAAFHFLNGWDQIRRMLGLRLLILPEVAYGDPAEIALDLSRSAAQAFDLPSSAFRYLPYANLSSTSFNDFLPLPDDTHLFSRGIPLPRRDPNAQVGVEGPSLEVRQALLTTALSPDKSDLVILGGPLPYSTWGDSDVASASFSWIAAHPWIWVLDGEDLLSFPRRVDEIEPSLPLPRQDIPIYTSSGALTSLGSERLQAVLRDELEAAPRNAITTMAWQTYLTLTAPSADSRLAALRAQYLGEIGGLLAASRWADSPYILNDCQRDLDYDGEAECILANPNLFAVLEADGGRLTYLFGQQQGIVRQIVGPTAQFALGLSDPSLWRWEQGIAADPSVIMGAFTDADSPFMFYRVQEKDCDTITFAAPDGGRLKTFHLTGDSLEVRYQISTEVTTRLPLLFDPQVFFFGGGKYQGALFSGGWRWGWIHGPQLQLETNVPFIVHGFNASHPLLVAPENPNMDYPTGHYYPFPFAIVTLTGQGDFRVVLRPLP